MIAFADGGPAGGAGWEGGELAGLAVAVALCPDGFCFAHKKSPRRGEVDQKLLMITKAPVLAERQIMECRSFFLAAGAGAEAAPDGAIEPTADHFEAEVGQLGGVFGEGEFAVVDGGSHRSGAVDVVTVTRKRWNTGPIGCRFMSCHIRVTV
jgi:hypothetical protein